MITIQVKNLRLRTFIGFNPEEKLHKQDVLIHYSFDFESVNIQKKDDVSETIDYKKINKKIISLVEQSSFDLLETLTQKVLECIMGEPRVARAQVEIEKPFALRFTDSVSVTLRDQRRLNQVVLSLGSNIDPEQNMSTVLDILSREFSVQSISEELSTTSLGDTSQPDYLNAVVLLETYLGIDQLMKKVQSIEDSLGRKRDPSNKNAARTIDIDVFIFNKKIIDSDFHTKPFIQPLVAQVLPEMSRS